MVQDCLPTDVPFGAPFGNVAPGGSVTLSTGLFGNGTSGSSTASSRAWT